MMDLDFESWVITEKATCDSLRPRVKVPFDRVYVKGEPSNRRTYKTQWADRVGFFSSISGDNGSPPYRIKPLGGPELVPIEAEFRGVDLDVDDVPRTAIIRVHFGEPEPPKGPMARVGEGLRILAKYGDPPNGFEGRVIAWSAEAPEKFGEEDRAKLESLGWTFTENACWTHEGVDQPEGQQP